jgi:hypothetical protein
MVDGPSSADRVYKVSWGQRAVTVCLLAFGSVFTLAIWGGIIFRQRELKLWEILFCPTFLLGSAYFVAGALASTVTLRENGIEVRTLFTRQSLPFDKIRGRRARSVSDWEFGNSQYLRLVPNDDRLSPIEFESIYSFDKTFYEWFNKLPDLDALDKVNHKNSNFGLV